MLQIIRTVLDLLRSGAPLPNFQDEAAVQAWLHNVEPALAKAIALIVQKLSDRAVGAEMSDAAEVEALSQETGIDIATILMLMQTLAPIIQQLIETWRKRRQQPQPTPTPTV